MIHLEHQNSIAIMRIAHGKVNTLDTELLSEFIDKLAAVEQSETRAMVLTGRDSSFSAGVDLFRVVNGGADYIKGFLPLLSEALLRLFTFPKPVVAAINGHAIAGGCILAWSCDYRLMAGDSGKIGIPELLVGVPFPSLPLEIVRFAVPKAHVQKVVYTGRTYNSAEALQYGLLDEITGPDELQGRAIEIAQQLATIPAESFQLTKRLMRQPTVNRYEELRQTIDLEIAKIWCSKELHDVIRAYLQKVVGKGK